MVDIKFDDFFKVNMRSRAQFLNPYAVLNVKWKSLSLLIFKINKLVCRQDIFRYMWSRYFFTTFKLWNSSFKQKWFSLNMGEVNNVFVYCQNTRIEKEIHLIVGWETNNAIKFYIAGKYIRDRNYQNETTQIMSFTLFILSQDENLTSCQEPICNG